MTTFADYRRPFWQVEVDPDSLAFHTATQPSFHSPAYFGLDFTATLLSHATTSYAFALRNTGNKLKLLRYAHFALTDGAAGSPAAAIEYGMDLFVVRHWTQTSVLGTLGTTLVPSPRSHSAMPMSEVAAQQSATMEGWDVRVPASSTATTVIATTEQFEADSNAILSVRGWHLIQAAGTQKTVDEMTYDARQPGLYPIVLDQWEGIALKPAVSTWANIDLTVAVEWEEIDRVEFDNQPWGRRTA